jgi:hypothetical protein
MRQETSLGARDVAVNVTKKYYLPPRKIDTNREDSNKQDENI